MKKLFLIKNPELFQGEKYLKKDKNYFEGWYFKNTNGNCSIAFIPGININTEESSAFIQVITDEFSYFVNYSIDDFKFNDEPFYIRIGNNYFSLDNIHIDINDEEQNLRIYGDIKYSDIVNIDTNFLYPNIMGLFSYVPFMECNHAIINMKSKVSGLISINDKKIKFDGGVGYIEKDWGCSFPKSYIWCQGNNFGKRDASFMLSIADIPFKVLHFEGIICVLIIGNKEYRFATYNNDKLVKYEVNEKFLNVILKKGHYYLEIKSENTKGLKLIAPVKGKMNKGILESISSTINVTLMKDDKIIFSDTSINSGLEIVLE